MTKGNSFDSITDQIANTPSKSQDSDISSQDTPLRSIYEKRIVAFIDILGFRNIVINSSEHITASGRAIIPEAQEPGLAARIYSALQINPESYREAFQSIHDLNENDFENLDLRISTFSDSVILSSANTAQDFAYLIHCVSFMVRELIRNGFLTRGGIALGEVYHVDRSKQQETQGIERVFGPAFIKAYDLESRHAGHARIILCNAMWQQVKSWTLDDKLTSCRYCGYINNLIKRDSDGPAKIHTLYPYISALESKEDITEELTEIKNRMESVLSYYTESPKIFSKLARFAKEYNKMINDCGEAKLAISDYHLP
jgi:hypothetical protein